MANLKAIRNRIKSVQSTQKITKAMKMVAAAKLRRAREAAEASRPYADALESILRGPAAEAAGNPAAPKLLVGNGWDQVQLLIVATSDRGLCGAFNSSIVRAVRRKIRSLQAEGKTVKLVCVGRKGWEQLHGEFGSLIVERTGEFGKKGVSYADAESIARKVLSMFNAGEFDVATIVYNHFKSVISQVVTFQQLVPLAAASEAPSMNTQASSNIAYEYEPSKSEILEALLPRNIGVQIYTALLENAASEQGARMTAMDNATRNAGEMIKKLTLIYNRSRQAAITKELIEIISGAEAV